MLAVASAENVKWVNSEELNVLFSIPESCTTRYSSSDQGLYVYAGEEGAVPYVLIVSRTDNLRFKNPEGYLGETYPNYMISRYGGETTCDPVRSYTFGGKTMLGARYTYRVDNYRLEQLKLIEIGTDRDMEYTVKYLEGEDKAVLALMDTISGSMQADSGDRIMPSGSTPSPATVPGDDARTGDDALSAAGNAKAEPSASGTVLVPDQVEETADTQNGVYHAGIMDLDRIESGGYFTVRLYREVTYPADRVEALKAGDRVQVNGTVYTVDSMVRHEGGVLELIPREEIYGYIVFTGKNGRYAVIVDDETLWELLTDVKIWMPLANNFSFAWLEVDETATVYDADGFVDLVNRDGLGELTPGHTTVQFEGGLLMTVLYTDLGM